MNDENNQIIWQYHQEISNPFLWWPALWVHFDAKGRIVEIYFDRIATEKLRVGMIIEGAFYELPQNKWYMDQVALVLPGFTYEDWEY